MQAQLDYLVSVAKQMRAQKIQNVINKHNAAVRERNLHEAVLAEAADREQKLQEAVLAAQRATEAALAEAADREHKLQEAIIAAQHAAEVARVEAEAARVEAARVEAANSIKRVAVLEKETPVALTLTGIFANAIKPEVKVSPVLPEVVSHSKTISNSDLNNAFAKAFEQTIKSSPKVVDESKPQSNLELNRIFAKLF